MSGYSSDRDRGRDRGKRWKHTEEARKLRLEVTTARSQF
ncbi:DDX5 isoform 6 [Pongo abelii]|uniref:DDX5 isoform 6 n=1 Tax=Pongo abelii TaxID=9601 RepID=A0A2J8UZW6_PONAB|nr:DDX5 isoform 6 [Pongo abelii]